MPYIARLCDVVMYVYIVYIITKSMHTAMVYCASKLMEKIMHLLNYYIKAIDHKCLWFIG